MTPKTPWVTPSLTKKINRWTSLAVVFFFSATTVSGNGLLYAQSVALPQVGNLEGIRELLDPVQIPAELGSLKDYYQPAASAEKPFIFHIQDAHANPDAQQKINGLLNWIESHQAGKDGKMLVSLEGSIDELHPEYLEFFPQYSEVNEAMVQDLVQKGELNGVELFAWDRYKKQKQSGLEAQEEKVQIQGAEDADLYRENLKTFRELIFLQDEIQALLKPVDANAELAKSRIFSPELREFIKERQRRKFGDYDNGESSPQLAAYLQFLSGQVKNQLQIDLNDRFEQVRFPNLVRLLVLGDLEKAFAPKKAREQKEKLMQALRKAAGKDQEKNLVEVFANLESGMPARGIAEKVWDWAASRGISLKDYPDYLKQLGAVILRSEVDSTELFSELDVLEGWLIEKLARTPEERELVRMLDDVSLVEKLLSLKWTADDQAKYQERQKEILDSVFGKRLPELAGKSETETDRKALQKRIDQALSFYEGARKRDEILLQNTLKNASNGAAVLVTGGFHTDGLVRLMKEKNIGYAVIQPKILKTDGGELYHKVLREETSDVSSYFETPTLNRQEAVFFKSLVESGAPNLWEKYQIPHAEIGAKVAEAANRHPILSGVLSAQSEVTGNASRIQFKVNPSRGESKEGPAAFDEQGVMIAPVTSTAQDFNRLYAPVAASRRPASARAQTAAVVEVRPAGTQLVTGTPAATPFPLDRLFNLRDQINKEAALISQTGNPTQAAQNLLNEAEGFIPSARALIADRPLGKNREAFQAELDELIRARDKLATMINPEEPVAAAPVSGRAELRTLEQNVEYIRELLNPASNFWPYDIEIISNTSEDERALREEEVKALTRGKVGPSGKPVQVLSIIEQWNKVKEPGKGGAGNLLGTINIYNEAKAAIGIGINADGKFTDNTGTVVRIRHTLNGGRAKRMNGLNQTEHSSRGSSSVFGDLLTRTDTATPAARPLTLFALVLATHAPLGISNDGSYIDDVYAGQVMVPSADVLHQQGNGALLVKFAQELQGDNAVTERNLKDLGLYEADAAGRILVSLPKGTFKAAGGATAVDAAKTWLGSHRGLYSLGSHRVAGKLVNALAEFYASTLSGPKNINREPPEFIKPMALLLRGIEADTTAASEIAAINPATVSEENISRVFSLLPGLQADLDAALREAEKLGDAGKIQDKKEAETAKYREVVRFYLTYNKQLGPNWLGVYDFGADSYWDRYRRPLEYANSNFLLLARYGTKIELNDQGSLVDDNGAAVTAAPAATTRQVEQAIHYATLRNIVHPITNTYIGKVYVDNEGRIAGTFEITFDDVQNGITIDGVYIKGSIIRNSRLFGSSRVISSLVQNSSAELQAENSFVHGSLAKTYTVKNGLVYNALTDQDVTVAAGYSYLGIQRPQLPADKGHQIVLNMPFTYNGQDLHAVPFNDAKHGPNFAPGYSDTQLAGITYEEINRMSENSSKSINEAARQKLWTEIASRLGRPELRAEEPAKKPGIKTVDELVKAVAAALKSATPPLLTPEEEPEFLKNPEAFLRRKPAIAEKIFTVPLQVGTDTVRVRDTLPNLIARLKSPSTAVKSTRRTSAAADASALTPTPKGSRTLAVVLAAGFLIVVTGIVGYVAFRSPRAPEKAPETGIVETAPVQPPKKAQEDRARAFDVAKQNLGTLKNYISDYLAQMGYAIVQRKWLDDFAPYYLSPSVPAPEIPANARTPVDRPLWEFEREVRANISQWVREGKLHPIPVEDIGRPVIPAPEPRIELPVKPAEPAVKAGDEKARKAISTEFARAQAQFFKEGAGLVRVNFLTLDSKFENALLPVDLVERGAQRMHSQPLAVAAWAQILADMYEGDIPSTVENPLDELEKVTKFRLAWQKLHGSAWFQITQNDRRHLVARIDPDRKVTGIEDINADFGMTFPTVGALLGGKANPKNKGTEAQADRIIAMNIKLIQGFQPIYKELLVPATGRLAGDYNPRTKRQDKTRQKDRAVEDFEYMALVVAAGYAPPSAFTGAKLMHRDYTDKAGNTYRVWQPYDGGAFQIGYNNTIGLSHRYRPYRILMGNSGAAFIDLANRNPRQSYFPGAAYIEVGRYGGKLGHPDLAEATGINPRYLVPGYAGGFFNFGFVVEDFGTRIVPLKLGNESRGGLYNEAYLLGTTTNEIRVVDVYSMPVIAPGVITAGNRYDMADDKTNDTLAALRLPALGMPDAIKTLDTLFAPASLGIDENPAQSPQVKGELAETPTPVVPSKKTPEPKVKEPVIRDQDNLVKQASRVGIFTQADSFPGNKAEKNETNGVRVQYAVGAKNDFSGLVLAYKGLDINGSKSLTLAFGTEGIVPEKVTVRIKAGGVTYVLKRTDTEDNGATPVKTGGVYEFPLDTTFTAAKNDLVTEVTVSITAPGAGTKTEGAFDVRLYLTPKSELRVDEDRSRILYYGLGIAAVLIMGGVAAFVATRGVNEAPKKADRETVRPRIVQPEKPLVQPQAPAPADKEEALYKEAAAKSPDAVRDYLRGFLQRKGYAVADEGWLNGMVPWYFAAPVRPFTDLTTEFSDENLAKLAAQGRLSRIADKPPVVEAPKGEEKPVTPAVVVPAEKKLVAAVIPPGQINLVERSVNKGEGFTVDVPNAGANAVTRQDGVVTLKFDLAGAPVKSFSGVVLKFDGAFNLPESKSISLIFGGEEGQVFPSAEDVRVKIKAPGEEAVVLRTAAPAITAGGTVEFTTPASVIPARRGISEITIEVATVPGMPVAQGQFNLAGIALVPKGAGTVAGVPAPAGGIGVFKVNLPAEYHPYTIDKVLSPRGPISREAVDTLLQTLERRFRAQFPQESRLNPRDRRFIKAVADFFRLTQESPLPAGTRGRTPALTFDDTLNFERIAEALGSRRRDVFLWGMVRWLAREHAEALGPNNLKVDAKGKDIEAAQPVTQGDLSNFAEIIRSLIEGKRVIINGRPSDRYKTLADFLDDKFRMTATRPIPAAPVVPAAPKPELRVQGDRPGIPHNLSEGPLAVTALAREYHQLAASAPGSVNTVTVVAEVDGQKRILNIPVAKGESPDVVLEYLKASIFNVFVVTGPAAIQIYGPAELAAPITAVREALLNTPKGYSVVLDVLKSLHNIPAAQTYPIEVLIGQPVPAVPPVEPVVAGEALRAKLASIQSIQGLAVGFDVGGTDAKIVIMDETSTQPILTKVYEWETKPADLTDASEFPQVFVKLIEFAVAAASVLKSPGNDGLKGKAQQLLKNPEAKLAELNAFIEEAKKTVTVQAPASVGISFPDVIANNEVLGGMTSKTAALRKKYDPQGRDSAGYRQEFNAYIKPLAARVSEGLQSTFGLKAPVPTGITNDGNVGSLWAAALLQQGSIFNIAGGTSLGGGYVAANGSFPTRLYELGYLVAFIGDTGHKHRTYDIFGTGQQLFSQDAVFELAIQKGLVIEGVPLTQYPKNKEAETLRKIQAMYDEAGTPEPERTKIREIFETIGEYLAIIVATSGGGKLADEFLKLILFGRPVSGTTGQIVMDRARAVLATFPEYASLDLKRASEVAREASLPADIIAGADKLAQAIGTIYVGTAERVRAVEDMQGRLSRAVQAYVTTPGSETFQALHEIIEAFAGLYGPEAVFEAARARKLDELGGFDRRIVQRAAVSTEGAVENFPAPRAARNKIADIITANVTGNPVSFPQGLAGFPEALFYTEASAAEFARLLGVRALEQDLPKVVAAATNKDITEALVDLAEAIDAHRALLTSPTVTPYEAKRAALALRGLPGIFENFPKYVQALSLSPRTPAQPSAQTVDIGQRMQDLVRRFGLRIEGTPEFYRFAGLVQQALEEIRKSELRTELLENDRVEARFDQAHVALTVNTIDTEEHRVTLTLETLAEPVVIYDNTDNLELPVARLEPGVPQRVTVNEGVTLYVNGKEETPLEIGYIHEANPGYPTVDVISPAGLIRNGRAELRVTDVVNPDEGYQEIIADLIRAAFSRQDEELVVSGGTASEVADYRLNPNRRLAVAKAETPVRFQQEINRLVGSGGLISTTTSVSAVNAGNIDTFLTRPAKLLLVEIGGELIYINGQRERLAAELASSRHESSAEMTAYYQGKGFPPTVYGIVAQALKDVLRGELRYAEARPRTPAVVNQSPVRRLSDVLFKGPEVSTRAAQQAVRPVIQDYRNRNEKLPAAAAEVAENVTETIYGKAEALSKELGIGVEEALALVVDQLVVEDVTNAAKFDLAMRAAREELGPDLADDLFKTGLQPLHLAPRVRTAAELKDEQNQLLIAFKMIQAPQDKLTVYYAPASPDKAGEDLSQADLDAIKTQIAGQVTRLGGNPKAVIQNLTLKKVDDQTNLGALRTSMINTVVKGRYASNQPAVLDTDPRFLQAIPVITTGAGRYLGRIMLREELNLSRALILMPAVDIGQDVVDMLTSLESKGYSRADISSRLSRFAQVLQKIAAAA